MKGIWVSTPAGMMFSMGIYIAKIVPGYFVATTHGKMDGIRSKIG